jgi:hypothetical protein
MTANRLVVLVGTFVLALAGPVVRAARLALEEGDVNLVLIWVQKPDEHAVVEAFQKTLKVRKLSREAQDLADGYFFETLVRLHRAGEGEPYTGLKPTGGDVGPALAAADKAIETAPIDPLKVLSTSMQTKLAERLREVVAGKNYSRDDVAAGRAYVESYVAFLTYVEQLDEAVTGRSGSHTPELHDGHADY